MSVYDEIEIEDFEFDSAQGMYFYPCPCGDLFQISEEALLNGEDIAECPSCSLLLRVIYDRDAFQRPPDSNEENLSSAISV
ncbi:Diphthamide biosynthesis protein 3 [Coelomomyces lativittatus]|nr:Diphthamide biosynthesis protein 3 [Coelomomyces lativittatus]KAJ1515687.1 Diphthamide biosynthesis protein 3 [Coelomomyces lativittatus]